MGDRCTVTCLTLLIVNGAKSARRGRRVHLVQIISLVLILLNKTTHVDSHKKQTHRLPEMLGPLSCLRRDPGENMKDAGTV